MSQSVIKPSLMPELLDYTDLRKLKNITVAFETDAVMFYLRKMYRYRGENERCAPWNEH